MKILLLGAGGMVGHTTALWLRERGYDVTGFCRTGSPVCRCLRGDARNQDTLNALLAMESWTHIVNCTGVLGCECEQDPISAAGINTLLPLVLNAHCERTGARLLHISTDYVFSGAHGHYKTSDTPDGSSNYARTKALGEVTGKNAVTIRTSVVGPDLRADGSGLLNRFLTGQMGLRGFAGAKWTGMTSLLFAQLTEQCLLHSASGLYHAVPDSSISKYELLCLIDRVFNGVEGRVERDETALPDTTLAPSPLPFAFAVPDYETMLRQLKDWMKAHSSLYPHYCLIENL